MEKLIDTRHASLALFDPDSDLTTIKLDVYYPTGVTSEKTPVLFLCYGGGFASGARTLPAPAEMLYANVGSYFAKKGFIAIIPDYRLVPEVKFPEPARDVKDAIQWAVKNPSQLCEGAVKEPNTEGMFLLGHSAGATHIFTSIAALELYDAVLISRIKGVILFSGPYHRAMEGTGFDGVLKMYYGEDMELLNKNMPLGILQQATSEQLKTYPNILLLEAEYEPDFVVIAGKDFYEEIQKREQLKATKIWAKGHNHISIFPALSSGEGEQWADDAVEWMRKI
jgi:acetyl esterase/lipase